MKGVKHYLKNGTEHKGAMHTTNGMPMTGAKHTKSSKDYFTRKNCQPQSERKLNRGLCYAKREGYLRNQKRPSTSKAKEEI